MTQDMQSRDATHTYNRNGDRQGRIHHRRTSLVSGSAFGLWYDYDTHGRPWKVFASTSTTKPGTPEATYTYFARTSSVLRQNRYTWLPVYRASSTRSRRRPSTGGRACRRHTRAQRHVPRPERYADSEYGPA